uniref:Uncharacterized protein n=1 Tax=Ditylum brightwellii TaxID=49249 RepID=A0A7S4R3H7_9STRA
MYHWQDTSLGPSLSSLMPTKRPGQDTSLDPSPATGTPSVMPTKRPGQGVSLDPSSILSSRPSLTLSSYPFVTESPSQVPSIFDRVETMYPSPIPSITPSFVNDDGSTFLPSPTPDQTSQVPSATRDISSRVPTKGPVQYVSLDPSSTPSIGLSDQTLPPVLPSTTDTVSMAPSMSLSSTGERPTITITTEPSDDSNNNGIGIVSFTRKPTPSAITSVSGDELVDPRPCKMMTGAPTTARVGDINLIYNPVDCIEALVDQWNNKKR